MFWASSNWLLPYGNRLPESKNSGKRYFLKNSLGQFCAVQSFLWKILFNFLMLFLRFLHTLSLFLNLHLNLLDSLILFEWIFNNIWHHQNNLGSFSSTLIMYDLTWLDSLKLYWYAKIIEISNELPCMCS